MQSTMLRRTVLGCLSLCFLTALAGGIAARSSGANPPTNPEIVFTERTSKNRYLRVMNADGSNVQTVVTGGKNDGISWPCWSPDGSRLAFAATLGSSSGVWVVNRNGTGLTRIVSLSHSASSLDWSRSASPDGRDKLAFSWGGTNSRWDVYVVNPDGSGLQVLLPAMDWWEFCWNHDATALVNPYLLEATDQDYFVLRHLGAAAGGGLSVTDETWIAMPYSAYMGPRAANTSDRLVYRRILGGTYSGLQTLDLGVVPPAAIQVTNSGEFYGSFSPDDSHLVYMRGSNIYTSRADGTGEVLIRSSTRTTTCNWPYWRHN